MSESQDFAKRQATGSFDQHGQLHGQGKITENGQVVCIGQFDRGQLVDGWKMHDRLDTERAMMLSMRGVFSNGQLTKGRQSFEVGRQHIFSQRFRVVTEGQFDAWGELDGPGVETLAVVERDGCLQCMQTISGNFSHGTVVEDNDMSIQFGGMYPHMTRHLAGLLASAWKLRCRFFFPAHQSSP